MSNDTPLSPVATGKAPPKHGSGLPLKRILLISLGSLLAMLLIGNAVLNVFSARNYLQSQFQIHAEDAATALGMSLSAALAEGDEVTASTVIDAVFDRGYYEHVILWDAHEKPWIVRHDNKMPESVPDWFVQLIPMQGRQGVADVSSGWRRLGSASVKVHPGLMYEKLWSTLKVEATWFSLVFILSVMALLLIIGRTTRPINQLVDMAAAIGKGDFNYRISPTGAREVRKLAGTMAEMAEKIQRHNQEQIIQIESLRNRLHIDAVTGALKREEFDRRLQAFLESRDDVGLGQLALIHMADFAAYNNKHGREQGDHLLDKICLQIKSRLQKIDGFFLARRGGAEFMCFMPSIEASEADRLVESIVKALSGMRDIRSLCRDDNVHAGLVSVMPGAKLSEVLANVDMALRNAQSEGGNGWKRFIEEHSHLPLDTLSQANEWREVIQTAVRDDLIVLEYLPVFAAPNEQVIYCKALSRIKVAGESLSAGVFMPMAERFGLVAEIDRQVVEKVIAYLDSELHYGVKIGVSLGTESLLDESFVQWLSDKMLSHPAASHCLFFEISEFTLQRDEHVIYRLVRLSQESGVTIVIDQFGQSSLPFSYLQSLPIKWIKFDRSLIQGVESKEEGRFYIQSITQIAHSQGVKVMGVGIESPSEWQLLKQLGVDAGAGYSLQKPLADVSGLISGVD